MLLWVGFCERVLFVLKQDAISIFQSSTLAFDRRSVFQSRATLHGHKKEIGKYERCRCHYRPPESPGIYPR